MSERHLSPEHAQPTENREKLALAEQLFQIAEEAARPLDDLAAISLVTTVTAKDLIAASQQVRRTIFNRSCDALGLTDSERQWVFDNA